MIKRSLSELLRIKKDEELAERGADVLEKVENALTKDLLALTLSIDSINSDISSLMDRILKDLKKARTDSVMVDIEALIMKEPVDNQIKMIMKKKFGKLISQMVPLEPKRSSFRWGASFAYESARGYSKKMLALLVDLGNAQIERDFVESELSRTRRRVNALRQIILPDLDSDKKKLEEWLDEETREELGRRHWVEKVVGI